MKADWRAVGDLVCAILDSIYVQNRSTFAVEAARRKITVEQLAAAAITEAVREKLLNKARRR